MQSVMGPLGTHKNYICHIAMENCVDYFRLLKSHREAGRHGTPDKYQELRHFLNAVESLNNIPDYLYFDTHKPWGEPSLEEFRQALCRAQGCVREVMDIANAYKHCVRGRTDRGVFKKSDKQRHAADLARTEIRFSAGMAVGRPLVDVQYCFKGIDNEALLTRAFGFWQGYLNDKHSLNVVDLVSRFPA